MKVQPVPRSSLRTITSEQPGGQVEVVPSSYAVPGGNFSFGEFRPSGPTGPGHPSLPTPPGPTPAATTPGPSCRGTLAHDPASSSSTLDRRSSTVTRPPMRPARLPSLATNQVCGRPVTVQLAATPPRRPAWSYTVG